MFQLYPGQRSAIPYYVSEINLNRINKNKETATSNSPTRGTLADDCQFCISSSKQTTKWQINRRRNIILYQTQFTLTMKLSHSGDFQMLP